MSNSDNQKDYKNLLKWDAENNEENKKYESKVVKKSKKVLKRQAKELEKQRKKGILKEINKSRITKKGKIFIIAGTTIALLAITAWILFGYLGVLFDWTRTLARAENVRVTTKELNSYMEFLKNQNPQSIPDKSDDRYKILQSNILDSILVLKVIESYGNKNGFKVNKEDIDAEYAKIVANYNSEDEFLQYLKDKKVSIAFLREQLKNQILRDKIFNKITEDVNVSQKEVEDYYNENIEELFTVPEQVKVSHILIKFNIPEGQELNDSIKKEAMEKILTVQKELSNGAEFAELAKKYSEDTISAENGGDIGFISKGQTVPEFEKSAFSLGINEVSQVIETYYGYHIIKVTDKKEEYIKKFEEVKDTINKYLLNNKQMEKWQAFITEIVKNSKIVYTTSLKGQLLNQDLSDVNSKQSPDS